jgi:hypothetical protein
MGACSARVHEIVIGTGASGDTQALNDSKVQIFHVPREVALVERIAVRIIRVARGMVYARGTKQFE